MSISPRRNRRGFSSRLQAPGLPVQLVRVLLDEILEEVLPDPDRYADDLSHLARWHRQM